MHATLQHACEIQHACDITARMRHYSTHARLQHACDTAQHATPKQERAARPIQRTALQAQCHSPSSRASVQQAGASTRTETHTACSQTFAPASVTPTPCMRHDAAQRTSRSGGTQPKVIARHAACACRAFTRPQTTARSMQRTYAIAPFGVRWANRFARFPSHAAFAAGTRVSPNPQQTVDTSRQPNQSGVQHAKHPCAQHPARTA